ncbi:NADPH:quinone reductase [Conexibacter sp. CPCC 206217]|uniref:NADPH:quinone reductase n=1 Tax=Conexibacter sp. CPCC 206217 TaxID=3064574 RepID=UPI0027170EEC|nr:NADPH:quinone reductase [Conexibacter sp. CPCC 206217]MDO8209550.1 NADPH:quinone reductase [Conexibacter sp. CPCC 206217]
MKAIVYTETGDPSVLTLVEREAAAPAAGEVRVRIVVSAVNPTDWKSRRGNRGSLPYAENVPNVDGAGVVDAVGDGVTHVAPGDRVWIFLAGYQHPGGGTAQELTVLPAERVVALPDGIGFDVGASLGVPAMTAHRALTVGEGGPTRLSPGALAGKTVLVAGGAGAVGHAAIQLARWAGATVITTISGPSKAALALAAGAHHAVSYRADDAAQQIRAIAPDGVDLIVEVSPTANVGLDNAVLANHGTIAIYANDGGDEITVPILPGIVANIRYQFLLLYTVGPAALAAAAEDITAALRDGALPVGEEAGLPLPRFPLERTADAHAAVEGAVVGKVLIDVSEG